MKKITKQTIKERYGGLRNIRSSFNQMTKAEKREASKIIETANKRNEMARIRYQEGKSYEKIERVYMDPDKGPIKKKIKVKKRTLEQIEEAEKIANENLKTAGVKISTSSGYFEGYYMSEEGAERYLKTLKEYGTVEDVKKKQIFKVRAFKRQILSDLEIIQTKVDLGHVEIIDNRLYDKKVEEYKEAVKQGKKAKAEMIFNELKKMKAKSKKAEALGLKINEMNDEDVISLYYYLKDVKGFSTADLKKYIFRSPDDDDMLSDDDVTSAEELELLSDVSDWYKSRKE